MQFCQIKIKKCKRFSFSSWFRLILLIISDFFFNFEIQFINLVGVRDSAWCSGGFVDLKSIYNSNSDIFQIRSKICCFLFIFKHAAFFMWSSSSSLFFGVEISFFTDQFSFMKNFLLPYTAYCRNTNQKRWNLLGCWSFCFDTTIFRSLFVSHLCLSILLLPSIPFST